MPALIMIVRSNPPDRELVRRHLIDAARTGGFCLRFIECGTGNAGIASCHAEMPNCILLDHHLTDMDGLEFLERLKQGAHESPVPVVVLTGSEEELLPAKVLRAGAHEYLPRSQIEPAALFRSVQSARVRFGLLNHPEVEDVWKALASSQAETRVGQTDLLASKAALATSQAETRLGRADLLASETALAASRVETQDSLADLLASAVELASSQTETQDGLIRLLASAAELSASQAETQDGLSDLVVSAAALTASQAETQEGQAKLLASAIVNKALRLANAVLIASDTSARESETRLREVLATRQSELERLVAERTKALVEAEARFRGIFDSQIQFISLLAPDGTVLEMNRPAVEVATLVRDKVIGRPFWETSGWSVEQRTRLRRDIAEAAAGKVVQREVEIRGSGGHDQGIWIDLSLKPVHNPVTGAVMWIIAESRDLTEKRNLAAQLAQAQKMQALGQLAAGIAHDFNNILQVVSGSAALIEQQPGDLERTRRLARSAISAADRGMSITQRLLSFARRGALRAEAVDTADLIDGVCDVLSHTLGAKIKVQANVQPGVPALIADRGQLETAFVNLCTNARDAMPDGGTLILSAEAEHLSEDVHHPAGLASGDYIRLTVSDTGTGMDAATLDRVTEPFFTTKPPGKGTGLGVAMVKGFVEQSGGGLSIASTPGAGTTVVMWFRQATDSVLRSLKLSSGRHKSISSTIRILMVDDDDLVREVLAAQLEAEGYHIVVAANGEEALALMEAGEVFDVLVSDLSMPGINGLKVIERAQKMCPRLPCFLLTGYVGDSAKLSMANAFTVVRKPVTGYALAAQIEAKFEDAKL